MNKFGNTLIVAPVEPMLRGQELGAYEPLPLHITLQPWFELPDLRGGFMNALSNFVYDQRPIQAERGSAEIFGHAKQVDILKSGGGLESLHGNLGQLIMNFGGVLNPSVAEQPFRPHVSWVEGRRVTERVIVDALQLVHRQADGSKLVGRRYSFKKSQK